MEWSWMKNLGLKAYPELTKVQWSVTELASAVLSCLKAILWDGMDGMVSGRLVHKSSEILVFNRNLCDPLGHTKYQNSGI